MSAEQSPTEITEEDHYWLRSKAVSDSPKIGGDQYFDDHDVPRPKETTEEDLPPADDVAVRKIDEDALDEEKFIGKWQVTGSAEEIEQL
jgi:hypothetical protein